MNKLIIPNKLKKGDTIGFVSPSAGLAPFAMHRIEKAKKFFEKHGYKVKIAKNALKNNGYVSASIEERVQDLHDMFVDKTVKLIMCTIGGNHSNQLIKYLDYDLIKNNPKIFIGYSDITVLHYAIQSMTGLATYYGPCVMTQFGENPEILPYTFDFFKKEIFDNFLPYQITASDTWTEEALNWFSNDDEKRPRIFKKNNGYEWLVRGRAKGFIVGGAIPSINHLIGTKYWLVPKDSILFIDIPEGAELEKGLSVSDVDSFLADLDNIGVFDVVRGVIVGRPYHYSNEQVSELKSVLLKYVGNKKCPTLYNVNVGHTDPIVTLRYGAEVEIDSDQNAFNVLS